MQTSISPDMTTAVAMCHLGLMSHKLGANPTSDGSAVSMAADVTPPHAAKNRASIPFCPLIANRRLLAISKSVDRKRTQPTSTSKKVVGTARSFGVVEVHWIDDVIQPCDSAEAAH